MESNKKTKPQQKTPIYFQICDRTKRSHSKENENGRKKKALQNNKRNEVWCLGRAHGSHSISCMRIKVNSLLPVVSLLFF